MTNKEIIKTNMQIDEDGIDGNVNFDDFFKLLKKNNKSTCHLFSATLSDNNVNFMTNLSKKDNVISHIITRDAIDHKLILDLNPYITNAGNANKLDAIYSVIVDIRNNTKNSKLDHCVLVTVANTKELKRLSKKLIKDNITTFSTDCTNGQLFNNKSIGNDIEEFKKLIKSTAGFRVVIHIKQLICGIDVDCFTDAIIYDFNMDDNCERTIIQIIGRCLRYLSEEERYNAVNGLSKKNLKTAGNIYFIDNSNDHTNVIGFLAAQYNSSHVTMFNLNSNNHSSTTIKIEPNNTQAINIKYTNLNYYTQKKNAKAKFEELLNYNDCFSAPLMSDLAEELKDAMTHRVVYDSMIANRNEISKLNCIIEQFKINLKKAKNSFYNFFK